MGKEGKRKLAAVMFADIQGYTALLADDEQKALSQVQVFKETLIQKTEKYSGKVIEFYGDGSLSVYDSAVDAVRCAIEMQTVFGKVSPVPVRIGIHLGDIVVTEDTVFGDGVNVAARIESIGVAGNILVSQQVEKQFRNQAGVDSTSMGKFSFKNVKDPLEVFAIKHEDVYMPQKKEIKGAKGKRVSWFKPIPLIVGLFTIAIASGLFYSKGFFKSSKDKIQEERIAVPSFKNFTGSSELDFIGEMAAHWITKELIQTESANVIDFYTTSEVNQMTAASTGNLNNLFVKQSGAVNIVDGAFEKVSKDSISFTAYIKNITDGSILHSFEPVYFFANNPREGIKQLADNIKGYWDTRGELLLSIPSFESYKYYLDARNQWLKNDDLAKDYLMKSIEEDSTFLDPYFLLLGYHNNMGQYQEALELIEVLKKKTKDLNSREQNILYYFEAWLKGQNQLSYSYILKDLGEHERDFFTTTEFMVFAIELVNKPEKAVEIFESQLLADINMDQCIYCQDRYYLAIASYLMLKKYDRAKALIDELPLFMKVMSFYSVQTKYHVLTQDINGVDEIIEKVRKYGDNLDYRLMYYYSAREFFLVGDMENSRLYAEKFLAEYEDSHWAKPWAYYFLNDYNAALNSYEQLVSEGDSSIRTLSQIGVMHSLLGDTLSAKAQIQIIEKLKKPFDYGAVPYNIARINLNLGYTEKALMNLQESVDEGARFYINNYFENDPVLHSIKDNAVFQSIIHPPVEDLFVE